MYVKSFVHSSMQVLILSPPLSLSLSLYPPVCTYYYNNIHQTTDFCVSHNALYVIIYYLVIYRLRYVKFLNTSFDRHYLNFYHICTQEHSGRIQKRVMCMQCYQSKVHFSKNQITIFKIIHLIILSLHSKLSN